MVCSIIDRRVIIASARCCRQFLCKCCCVVQGECSWLYMALRLLTVVGVSVWNIRGRASVGNRVKSSWIQAFLLKLPAGHLPLPEADASVDAGRHQIADVPPDERAELATHRRRTDDRRPPHSTHSIIFRYTFSALFIYKNIFNDRKAKNYNRSIWKLVDSSLDRLSQKRTCRCAL